MRRWMLLLAACDGSPGTTVDAADEDVDASTGIEVHALRDARRRDEPQRGAG